MSEARVRTAQERLAQAKARVRGLSSPDVGEVDWDALRTAQLEVLGAERELAAATGQEYAVELTLEVRWDTGAPLPFLVSNGSTAAVVFYLEQEDPPATLGVVEFDGVHEVRFGGLNDEAIHGHPLWGKGLDTYAAHEVVNSTWITSSERQNSVHPHHQGGWHDRLRHYVLCFHDETLECLATGLRAYPVAGALDAAVHTVSRRVLGLDEPVIDARGPGRAHRA